MTKIVKRVILDANILINYCSNLEKTHNKINDIFLGVENDEIIVFLPDLAFYELIYNLKKQNQAKELLDFLKYLTGRSNVFTYKMDNKELYRYNKNIVKL